LSAPRVVHGAAPRASDQLAFCKTARIQARAAEQHKPLPGEHALQHALDVVVTLGRLLLGLGRQ
jgi:hypothetical protein